MNCVVDISLVSQIPLVFDGYSYKIYKLCKHLNTPEWESNPHVIADDQLAMPRFF